MQQRCKVVQKGQQPDRQAGRQAGERASSLTPKNAIIEIGKKKKKNPFIFVRSARSLARPLTTSVGAKLPSRLLLPASSSVGRHQFSWNQDT
jgi:hypothetical protein